MGLIVLQVLFHSSVLPGDEEMERNASIVRTNVGVLPGGHGEIFQDSPDGIGKESQGKCRSTHMWDLQTAAGI